MRRNTLFGFHYKPDCWRASQVRNMGIIEGNCPVSDNEWESITKGGDDAIKKWISGQLDGKLSSHRRGILRDDAPWRGLLRAQQRLWHGLQNHPKRHADHAAQLRRH